MISQDGWHAAMRAHENRCPDERSSREILRDDRLEEAMDDMVAEMATPASLIAELQTESPLADTLCSLVSYATDPDSANRDHAIAGFVRWIRNEAERRKRAMQMRRAA